MSWLGQSQEHLPLTWWRGHPIYLSAVLALAGIASMILTAVLSASGGAVLGALVFSFDNLAERFLIWTLVTYVLVNVPSLWVVLGCYLLWRFGESVERHLGRRAFVRMVVLMVLALPVFSLLLGLAGWRSPGLAGITHLQFGVFLAFATLYPRAQISLIIATIDVWILAAILVGVYALSDLAAQDWYSLLMLAAETGIAYGFIRHEQGRLRLPSLSALAPRLKPPQARRAGARRPEAALARAEKPKQKRGDQQPAAEVDAILDKISRDGMHSLTAEERVTLEQASHDLQRRKR